MAWLTVKGGVDKQQSEAKKKESLLCTFYLTFAYVKSKRKKKIKRCLTQLSLKILSEMQCSFELKWSLNLDDKFWLWLLDCCMLPLAKTRIRYLHFNLQPSRLCHTRINSFFVQTTAVPVNDHLKFKKQGAMQPVFLLMTEWSLQKTPNRTEEPLSYKHDSLPANICRLSIWCIVLHGGLYKGSSILCL